MNRPQEEYDVTTVRSDTARVAISPTAAERPEPRFHLRDYAILLKPRVMSLVVFTALVGLLLAPTPAFFVNGRLVSGAQPLEAFAELIDEELGGK